MKLKTGGADRTFAGGLAKAKTPLKRAANPPSNVRPIFFQTRFFLDLRAFFFGVRSLLLGGCGGEGKRTG